MYKKFSFKSLKFEIYQPHTLTKRKFLTLKDSTPIRPISKIYLCLKYVYTINTINTFFLENLPKAELGKCTQ